MILIKGHPTISHSAFYSFCLVSPRGSVSAERGETDGSLPEGEAEKQLWTDQGAMGTQGEATPGEGQYHWARTSCVTHEAAA